MTLSFPLGLDEFSGMLKVMSANFYLPDTRSFSETGGGELLPWSAGVRLWAGEAKLKSKLPTRDAAKVRTLIETLSEVGGSFLAFDPALPGPAYDPDGTIIAAASPVLASVSAQRTEISLSGLPSGYTLERGNRISFQYSSGPVRYALHSVVDEIVVTPGPGITPVFQVSPPVREGVTGTPAVELYRAYCKAVIVPKSYSPGMDRKMFSPDISFKFQQTLR